MGPNNIQLGAGTLSFKLEDEPMEATTEPEEMAFWPKENPVIKGVESSISAATLEVLPETFGRIKQAINMAAETAAKLVKQMLDGVVPAALKVCPNRRVAHLAIHGKSRRVRKKNWRRVFEIVMNEKEEEGD